MPYRMIKENRIKRLLDMTEKNEDGCWEWQGNKTPGGYGASALSGKKIVAHRVAYMLLVGDIPCGQDLDHLCRNRACINPDHLEPVSRRRNLIRGFTARGCANGHPYSKENTSYVSHGDGRTTRRCKICHRSRNKKAKAARLAA